MKAIAQDLNLKEKTGPAIQHDKPRGVLIARLWLTQTWFPLLLQLLADQPWVIQPSSDLLKHLSHNQPHPLHKNLAIAVYVLCQGKRPMHANFSDVTQVLVASWTEGTQKQCHIHWHFVV